MKIRIMRDKIKGGNNYGRWYVTQGDVWSGLYLSNKTGGFGGIGASDVSEFYFDTRQQAREALAKYKGVPKKAQKKRRAVKPKAKLFTAADRERALKNLRDNRGADVKGPYSMGWVACIELGTKWLCTDGDVRGSTIEHPGIESKRWYYKDKQTAEDALLVHFNILPKPAKPVVVPQPKVFGYSYLLDMYDCAPGVADDMELTYRFLETLVDKLGMTRMSQPFVIHGPTKDGKELYPEKAGVSAWVPLIESGVQIHSLEPTHFITLDCYSCKHFDKNVVLEYARECFKFKKYEEHWLERGKQYAT